MELPADRMGVRHEMLPRYTEEIQVRTKRARSYALEACESILGLCISPWGLGLTDELTHGSFFFFSILHPSHPSSSRGFIVFVQTGVV